MDKYEKTIKAKTTRANYRKARQTGGYFIYYIPSIHYCGIAKDLYVRESWHRTQKNVDTTGLKVLFHSMDRVEAAYHEALFQSVLAIKGLNVNKTL